MTTHKDDPLVQAAARIRSLEGEVKRLGRHCDLTAKVLNSSSENLSEIARDRGEIWKQLTEARELLERILASCTALPKGSHPPKAIEKWLWEDMFPVVQELKAFLDRTPTQPEPAQEKV